jgi:hypothetical protein
VGVADDSVLSDRDRELFEGSNIGHLATLNDDGSPQVSPVWVDLEGDLVVGVVGTPPSERFLPEAGGAVRVVGVNA